MTGQHFIDNEPISYATMTTVCALPPIITLLAPQALLILVGKLIEFPHDSTRFRVNFFSYPPQLRLGKTVVCDVTSLHCCHAVIVSLSHRMQLQVNDVVLCSAPTLRVQNDFYQRWQPVCCATPVFDLNVLANFLQAIGPYHH